MTGGLHSQSMQSSLSKPLWCSNHYALDAVPGMRATFGVSVKVIMCVPCRSKINK